MGFSTALTASRKELEREKAGSSYRDGAKPIWGEMMERGSLSAPEPRNSQVARCGQVLASSLLFFEFV